jgi:SAM-dependent methyltransferase
MTKRDAAYANAYSDLLSAEEQLTDDFIRLRYEEGRRWRGVVRHYAGDAKALVLDVGGGNGAVELAFEADDQFQVVSIEALWNDSARQLGRLTGAPMRRVIGDAARLPFREAAFDIVTCLETIEHLTDAARTAAELARVTHRGSVLLLTTPPRWRYAFRPDPHFGIRSLALLPARYQRSVAAARGFSEPQHYVDRLYGSMRQITALFRDFALGEVLSRSRAPRRWFWDAVVLRRR